jgi:hypothetical protein
MRCNQVLLGLGVFVTAGVLPAAKAQPPTTNEVLVVIESCATGRPLQVPDESRAGNGTRLRQGDKFVGRAGQAWIISPVAGEPGVFRISSYLNREQVMDAEFFTNDRNGTIVQTWTWHAAQAPNPNQKWRVIDLGNGVGIQSAHSKRMLDVDANRLNDLNATISLWDSNGSHQKFSLRKLPSTFRPVVAEQEDTVGKVFKFLIHPSGPLLDKLAEEVGPMVSIDSKELTRILDPGAVLVEKVPDAIKAQIEVAKAPVKIIDAVQERKPEKALEALTTATRAQVDFALKTSVRALRQPPINPIVLAAAPEASLETPVPVDDKDVDLVGKGYPGAAIVYVNGMATEEKNARAEAMVLAKRVQRPVRLIYNPTDGPADVPEVVYDRTWPFLPPIEGQSFQLNNTTRQLAYLIHHSGSPLAIVSYSQGCMCVNNALFIANARSGGKAKDRVCWLACGLPINDSEILVKPRRFLALANPDDAVSQSVGLRLDYREKFRSQNFDSAHSFIDAYVNQINPEDLRIDH